jgi:hypothetical protein
VSRTDLTAEALAGDLERAVVASMLEGDHLTVGQATVLRLELAVDHAV